MFRKNDRSMFSQLLVLVMTCAILAGQTMFAVAMPGRASTAGVVTVTGLSYTGEKPFVVINGEHAFSGRSFFSGGTITTPATSSASLDFGKVGRINLGPSSTLELTVSSTNISGVLSTGDVSVSSSEGVTVRITTPDDTVTNEGTSPSRFAVNVVDNHSSVAAEIGSVRYNNGTALATAQADDDDDKGNIWIPIIVIGGAVGVIFIAEVLEDRGDLVSPVR